MSKRAYRRSSTFRVRNVSRMSRLGGIGYGNRIRWNIDIQIKESRGREPLVCTLSYDAARRKSC
jgi:hypothetical protein